MEQVTYMRMQAAQEFLESGDETLEWVAHRVGYHSATVFGRAFVRCMGMTPSQFRVKG
ncbi:MAG: helix-turn-helix domain-containing protein [Prosthecobacter sp.]|uniref:helix-turn-helix domain-containing protein n=1 Tax=Prosthecobacter sp. TaxID=1965333 RepID=UPI00390415A8